MTEAEHHPSSFRDPSGFVFFRNGKYYRHIHPGYAEDYDLLMNSGLYEKLRTSQSIIAHAEIPENISGHPDWYKTLQPEQIPFISYPYEWCFEQLKEVALLCLDILKTGLDHGMVLKDASAFNFQLLRGRPILIDSLSFQRYNPSEPWVAYRAFCEGFLFPLLLGHYLGIDSLRLLAIYPQGIPLPVAAAILPGRSRFSLSAWMHVHLQNRLSRVSAETQTVNQAFTRAKFLRLIDHLRNTISLLDKKKKRSGHWQSYYQDTIASANYLEEKAAIFRTMISKISFAGALDLGCNNGYFSEILASRNVPVISLDSDSACISAWYRKARTMAGAAIFPLVVDILNPSPDCGLFGEERKSILTRVRSELVCALAIVHHLVLAGNIPLPDLARLMAGLSTQWLVIEFIPLEDPRAAALVARKGQFHRPYDGEAFEKAFGQYFETRARKQVPGSVRTIYLMEKK